MNILLNGVPTNVSRSQYQTYADQFDGTTNDDICPAFDDLFGCTLDKGHSGPHIAHGENSIGNSTVISVWDQQKSEK